MPLWGHTLFFMHYSSHTSFKKFDNLVCKLNQLENILR
jgi:hypothetical protein